MYKILTTLLIFFLSNTILASGPQYQVLPQLKGLVVNYNVTSSSVETTLYVTNHERIPVVCDANMATNRQEISKGRDTTITPGKTAAFSFRHGRSITDVRLYLMCEAAKPAAAEDGSVPSEEAPTVAPAKEPPSTQQPAVPVVEEDLDRY